jgi:hypothetical protein
MERAKLWEVDYFMSGGKMLTGNFTAFNPKFVTQCSSERVEFVSSF